MGFPSAPEMGNPPQLTPEMGGNPDELYLTINSRREAEN